MNIRQLPQFSKRLFGMSVPMVLAILALMTFIGASANNASSAEPLSSNQETSILDNGSVITIGATMPLTVPGAYVSGEAMKVAMEIAADEINAAGGVLGMPIRLVISDTAGTPELGEAAMDYFAQIGVAGVVGEYHSGVGLPMVEKAHEHHIPTIFAETWNDNITAPGYDEVFRIGPTSSMVRHFDSTYIAELGLDNVVIMTEDSVYGNAAAASLAAELTERGIAPQIFTATVGTVDFTPVVSDMLTLSPTPQAVVVLVTGGSSYAFEQQAAEAGLAPSSDTVCIANQIARNSEAFWQNVPDGNYCVFRRFGMVPALNNNRTQAFVTEYMSRTGKAYPEMYAMEAYDSLIIMADAIERAGSTDPDAIITALETTDLVGAQGRYYFPYGSSNPVPGDVPDYMWHQWPDPHVLMLQYHEVGQTMEEAAVVYPPVYQTHGVNLIPYGGMVTFVPTDTASTLVYTDTQGLTTTLDIPSGSVTETATLIYTPVTSPTHDANLQFAGHAFSLEIYQDGNLQPGFVFSKPVTITIHYSQEDVDGMDEDNIHLDYWDEENSKWADAATTCTPPSVCDRHTDDNWLAVPICRLSEFALYEGYSIYLPGVVKTYSP